ncbi:MAG: PilZ domain-containing protein [Candidatus Omnitrophica bacterium]|nr:PilZ domain-containing protein [Candidatus Omnitrophota bacterium]MCM8831284.1 PilZ domain-containing protein [Candidatus Omnitrophota bacterium]
MAEYTGPERRKYPRININFVVSYRIKEVPDNFDISQTKNVSGGGILLTTNRKFEKGTLLALNIRFPFIGDKIEVTGEVVDAKEIVRDLIYETRIKFLDLRSDVLKQLEDFVLMRFKK